MTKHFSHCPVCLDTLTTDGHPCFCRSDAPTSPADDNLKQLVRDKWFESHGNAIGWADIPSATVKIHAPHLVKCIDAHKHIHWQGYGVSRSYADRGIIIFEG